MTTAPQAIPTESHDFYIHATPERVWHALTTGEVSVSYFYGTYVRSAFTPGASITWTAGPDGPPMVDGHVVAVEPARLLVNTWTVRYDPALADETSEVEWRLDPQGAVTRLRVTHRLPDAPKTAAHLANGGWGWVLSGLKTLLETGAPLPAAPGA